MCRIPHIYVNGRMCFVNFVVKKVNLYGVFFVVFTISLRFSCWRCRGFIPLCYILNVALIFLFQGVCVCVCRWKIASAIVMIFLCVFSYLFFSVSINFDLTVNCFYNQVRHNIRQTTSNCKLMDFYWNLPIVFGSSW